MDLDRGRRFFDLSQVFRSEHDVDGAEVLFESVRFVVPGIGTIHRPQHE